MKWAGKAVLAAMLITGWMSLPAGETPVGVSVAEAPVDGGAGAVEGRKVYGWKEWILFEGKKVAMRAKFDSGALTSSIHSEHVKTFEKDGEDWVRFTVFDPNKPEGKNHAVEYECRITRMARIRNADGERSVRPVVELDFWIGGEKRRTEFSLNDRGDMINPVLLGRSCIQTLGLIDVGRTYTTGTNPKKPLAPEQPVSEAEPQP